MEVDGHRRLVCPKCKAEYIHSRVLNACKNILHEGCRGGRMVHEKTKITRRLTCPKCLFRKA